MTENFLALAGKILSKPRYEAEGILQKNGYSETEAAEVVSAHTRARSQIVVGSPREVSMTMINAKALSARLRIEM